MVFLFLLFKVSGLTYVVIFSKFMMLECILKNDNFVS